MLRKIGLIIGILIIAVPAFAVPVLQVGAPGPPGTYADYLPSLTNPTETDTAITSGTILYLGGIYQQANVQNLGGKYTGGGGKDWSSVISGLPTIFDGHGAILLASVPEGSSGSLTISVQFT